MTTPILGAPDWAAAQASPWLTVNQALRIIEAMARRGIIIDRDLTAPPGSCDDGSCYLVDATATGVWATHDGELAIAVGEDASNGWFFIDVEKEGTVLYVQDENTEIRWTGSQWAIGGGGTMAINNQTTAYELELSDAAAYVRINVATGVDLTIPANADVPFEIGTEIPVRQVGGGQLTVVGAGGVTINVPAGCESKARGQGASISLFKAAANVWDLTGDLEVTP